MNNASSIEQRLAPLAALWQRTMNAHRFLWLLLLLSFFVAWNRGLELLYGLVALLLAVLFMSWVMPWWLLRSVRISRSAQSSAVAGGDVRLRYTLSSEQPLYYAKVAEHIPGSNAQTFFVPLWQPNQALEHAWHCAQRGVFALPSLQVGCAWPFGFVELTRSLPDSDCTIVVCPRVFDIGYLPLVMSEHQSLDGMASQQHQGGEHEYAGVRAYRAGDALKHIHWSVSARQQQWMVREFHQHSHPSWLLVVDANPQFICGSGGESSFEMALSIAASLVRFATAQHIALRVVVGCKKPLSFEVGPQHDDRVFMEQLAYVEPDGDMTYDELVAYAQRELDARAALITVRSSDQPPVKTLGGHVDIVMAAASFEFPLAHYIEGWRQLSLKQWRLDVHRRCELERVFNR